MAEQLAVWSKFIDGLDADGAVPQVILESWHRSERAGVERERFRFRRVADAELHSRQQASAGWLDVARSHLEWLARAFRHIEHVVYVTDSDGIVLASAGDPSMIDTFALSPGCDWSESRMGTNGAGTALVAEQPVAVVGSQHFVDAFGDCTCTGAPIHAPDGSVVGALDISTSVADAGPDRLFIVSHAAYAIGRALVLRDTEARYSNTEERLLAALAASDTGTFRWQVDTGRFLDFDDSLKRLFGLAPDDPIGTVTDVLSRIHPDDRARVRRAMARCRRGEDLEMEFRVVMPDGGTRWLFERAKMTGEAGAGAACLVGACIDVTRRKKVEERLLESDRAKDEFLAVLGHELRNPLAPLQTGLEVLAHASGKPGLLDRVLPMMNRQLSHLVRLVDDLLDIARVSRGKIDLDRRPLDVNAPVRAAVEQLDPVMAARGHHFEVALADRPLVVDGDLERLTEVVANLLSNAARYTPPGGTVSVHTEEQHGEVVIRVRDSGYGIPPQRADKLFKLFSQVPEHREHTGGGGLGVGLALSRQLIELHGGSIGVESGGVGCGSEFFVRLPKVVRNDESADAGPADPSARAPLRVLVVDDRVDTAEGLRMLLELNGHLVRAVHDGRAALLEAEHFAPEAVLLDLGLPGMDGVEVARRMRAHPACRNVVLVAVTGWGQDEDRLRTRDAGIDFHLTKPVDWQQLASILEDVPRSS